MSDFDRKVEEAAKRFSRSIGEAAEKLEKETAELVSHMNDEIVPKVRQHSGKALRTASEKLAELAKYMEQGKK
jgi:hypothetical protein